MAGNGSYKNNRADQITQELREKLKDHNCKIHYLYIDTAFSLSIWIMMPELGSDSGKDVSYFRELAHKKGDEIINLTKKTFPDLDTVFDIINPMIVDSYFNSWYIDYIQLKKDSFKYNFLYNYDDNPDNKKAFPYLRTAHPVFKEQNWKKFGNEVDTLSNRLSTHSNTTSYIVTEKGESKEQVFIVVQKDLSDKYIIDFTIAIKKLLKKHHVNITIIELFLLNNEGKIFSYSIIEGRVSTSKDNKIKKYLTILRL